MFDNGFFLRKGKSETERRGKKDMPLICLSPLLFFAVSALGNSQESVLLITARCHYYHELRRSQFTLSPSDAISITSQGIFSFVYYLFVSCCFIRILLTPFPFRLWKFSRQIDRNFCNFLKVFSNFQISFFLDN